MLLVFWSPNAEAQNATVTIAVDPTVTRSIRGISELDRQRYFAICETGINFDKKVKNGAMYQSLVHDLRIHFGRSLGPIQGATRWGKAVREDPTRPGHVDLTFLRETLTKNHKPQSEKLLGDFGKNLNVSSHGQHNAFPEFLGKYISSGAQKHPAHGDKDPEYLPKDIEAAAELSAAVFKYDYDNFTRPRAYEPVNEPHWSYMGDTHLADWHIATKDRMHEEVPGVAVGGPCSPVAYFYNGQYKAFNGIRQFIDNTRGELDFYSFHVYDYIEWDGDDFNGGRITSGLPLEGVLDLIPNYTMNTFKKEVPIVVSETGGYSPAQDGVSANDLAEKILTEHSPGQGFEWKMKARSILDFNQISSTIGNVLAFMDHPHTVKKSVPFILLNSFGWDTKYNSVLYTPKDFEDKEVWVPTGLHKYYELFRDLEGRRVKAISPDPDVQTRAFVSGTKLFVITNNLWTKKEVLHVKAPKPKSIKIRRFGRNPDFTPYLREEAVESLENIPLAGREAVIVIADYGVQVPERRRLMEIPLYGDKVTQSVESTATFRIRGVPSQGVDHAILRIGLNRPPGSGKEVNVKLNGKPMIVSQEDCADRLTDPKNGYATTKLLYVDPSKLRADNIVSVSFGDGGAGTVGSVVLRVAAEVN